MSRAQLRAIPKRKAPSLSLVKKALRLYRSDFASKELRRANARKWLAMVAHLGSHWVYAGRSEVNCGSKQERKLP